MKKFSLAYLLKLRDLARRQQQAKLAECLLSVEGVQQRLRQVEQQLRAAREWQALPAAAGRTSVADLKANYEFIRSLDVRRQQLKTELRELGRQLESERKVFQNVDRDAKALEKLRKRHSMGQLQIEARAESHRLDQLAQHPSRNDSSYQGRLDLI